MAELSFRAAPAFVREILVLVASSARDDFLRKSVGQHPQY
jgi:hypothetical protein